MKFEDYLAPWERGEDGKKLDEPAEIDATRLKKYLFGLENDKDELQVKVTEVERERDGAKDDLIRVQREHENEDQRREREAQETKAHYAKLEKAETERKKVDAIADAFKAEGITAERAKRLAKRIPTDVDEKDWVKEAKELVEDGFRISDKPAGEQQVEEEVEESIETVPRPNVRRSDGGTVKSPSGRGKSPADELAAAGIGQSGW